MFFFGIIPNFLGIVHILMSISIEPLPIPERARVSKMFMTTVRKSAPTDVGGI